MKEKNTNSSISHFLHLNSGPILIVMAAVLWALDGIIRRSLYSLSPIVIVFYEHLIGLVFLLPFAWQKIRQIKLTRRIVWLTITIGFLSGLLGTLWFTSALIKVNYISFSVVYLLQKLQPLFAIGSAHFLLKERANSGYWKWAGLALIAAYFVTFPNGMVDWSAGSAVVSAALLALGAAAAWGTSTTFSKMLLEKVDHQQATALRFIATTVLAFGGVLIMRQAPQISSISGSQLLRFIFIAISTGMVALLIYYKGLKQTKAHVSTILELTFPMLAIFIDAILYQSFLLPSQYLAGAVLLFAMYRVGKL